MSSLHGIKIVSGLPVEPQAAHIDYCHHGCQIAKSKTLFAIAAACSKGSMLLVWMKDSYMKNNHMYYSYFYVFIPFRSIIYLPRGYYSCWGFCFG